MESPTKRRLRTLGMASFYFFSVLGGIVTGYLFRDSREPHRLEEERKWVENWGPKPGDTREQVEKILDGMRIWHTYSTDLDKKPPPYIGETPAQIGGLDSSELEGFVMGEIPSVNVDPINTGEIRFYFFFDKQGKLVKHVVRSFVD